MKKVDDNDADEDDNDTDDRDNNDCDDQWVMIDNDIDNER